MLFNYWGWHRGQEKGYSWFFLTVWFCLSTIACILLLIKFSKDNLERSIKNSNEKDSESNEKLK